VTDIQNPTDWSEEWRSVVEYEGVYEVSSLGRVRRTACGRGATAGRILSDAATSAGYRSVSLNRNNKARSFLVHRLVAHAFVGEPPERHEVNHLDGDKANNMLANLEYVTRSGNVSHAYRTGLRRSTLRTPEHPSIAAKLTADQIRLIRALYRPRVYGTPRLAREFGVHQSTIHKIVSGKSWSELT